MRKERKEVTEDHLDMAFDIFRYSIKMRMKKHGPLSFITKHESLGVITEEYLELIEAAKLKTSKGFDCEMIDIGVATIFHIASELSYSKKSCKNNHNTKKQKPKEASL